MQFTVHLDQEALDAFDESLKAISDRALDAEPAMIRIADDFQETERLAFATGGGRLGEWTPDSEVWAATKAKRGKGSRTLVYTGTLERSLIEAHAKYSLRVTGPGELIVGTLDPVAHLHQDGTGDRYVKTRNGQPLRKQKYSGKMPMRRMLQVLPSDEVRWSQFVSEHLTGESGFKVGL